MGGVRRALDNAVDRAARHEGLYLVGLVAGAVVSRLLLAAGRALSRP